MDNKLTSVVAFLDLSAAFDTLDHHILTHRLNTSYGIQDKALQWFSSYLSCRKQTVTVGNSTSVSAPLLFGVPQGSVLGPILFTLYTQPLSDTLNNNKFDYHKYADDTELQKAVPPSDFSHLAKETSTCISDVKIWMNKNKLKLNDDKTELLAVGDRKSLSQVKKEPLTLSSSSVPFQSSAKCLGVHLDETLSMNEHISSLCRSSYFHLRKINSIRPYLSVENTAKLVLSLVLSRLDYCNAILSGLPSSAIHRLQKVQNNAARLVLRKKRSDHVTPLLMQLHWLPITARIQYKVATLPFRHFEKTLPPYLSDLLYTYQPSRTLRSCNEKLLKIPKTNRKFAGNRSFRFQAPQVWNSLPTTLRNSPSLNTFKTNLKTYLFQTHYCH